MDSTEDLYYAQKVAEGDSDAFVYFVKKYQQMALSIAITIVKDETKAKDAVQNAFINTYKRIGSFKGESKFSSWFYRIVVNDSIKVIRNENKYHTKIEPFFFENIKNVFNESVKKIEITEQKNLINKLLKLMKPKEALIIKLFYLEEYNIKEIEELTGFKRSNIKVLLHRARKNFMTLYLKYQKHETIKKN